MKFICLGYADHAKFASMTAAEAKQVLDDCFAYDDVLRSGGHFVGGEALQAGEMAVTLRFRGETVEATDGPFAETREQIGGILILEAESMEQAVQLMSNHPGVRIGPFEIRPADEQTNEMIRQRDERFRQNHAGEI